MGVPTSEVGYNSATARRGDHEISYEYVVALKKMFEGVCSTETSLSVYQSAICNIPKDVYIQSHRCVDSKSHNVVGYLLVFSAEFFKRKARSESLVQ